MGHRLHESIAGMSPAKKMLLAAEALFFLLIVAYSNSFVAQFHLDDLHQITENEHIRQVSNIPKIFVDAGMLSGSAGLKGYRPVTTTTFALNYALGGYQVWGYHLFNVIIHFINAFLVFIIVYRVLRKDGEDHFFTALAVSLIFALHPLQTSAVTYISGRAVLLATFFYLTAFICFLNFREGAGRKHLLWAVLAATLYLLGLLSKEMAVSLPAVMLAYDLVYTLPGGKKEGLYRKLLAYYAGLLAMTASYILLKKTVEGSYSLTGITALEYLVSEAKVFLLYVRLLFLPMNQNADYNLPVTRSLDMTAAASFLVVGACLYLLFSLRKKNPAAAFFGSWFFLALAPESTLVPIPDIAVEYRLYLPSAGFIAALVVPVSGVPWPSAKKALAGAVILMLLLTVNRNIVWEDHISYWTDVIKKAPYSARAHGGLATALIYDGRYDEAADELRLALDMDSKRPDIAEPASRAALRGRFHTNLGTCLLRMGDVEGAIREYRAALSVYPYLVETYINLGEAFGKKGNDLVAIKALEKAIRMKPSAASAHYMLAGAYSNMGRDGEALGEMRAAAIYSPDSFKTNIGLAVMYIKAGMKTEALDQARKAAGLARTNEQARAVDSLIESIQKSKAPQSPSPHD